MGVGGWVEWVGGAEKRWWEGGSVLTRRRKGLRAARRLADGAAVITANTAATQRCVTHRALLLTQSEPLSSPARPTPMPKPCRTTARPAACQLWRVRATASFLLQRTPNVRRRSKDAGLLLPSHQARGGGRSTIAPSSDAATFGCSHYDFRGGSTRRRRPPLAALPRPSAARNLPACRAPPRARQSAARPVRGGEPRSAKAKVRANPPEPARIAGHQPPH